MWWLNGKTTTKRNVKLLALSQALRTSFKLKSFCHVSFSLNQSEFFICFSPPSKTHMQFFPLWGHDPGRYSSIHIGLLPKLAFPEHLHSKRPAWGTDYTVTHTHLIKKEEVFKNKAWQLGAEYNRQFLISVLYVLFLTGLISSRGLKGI